MFHLTSKIPEYVYNSNLKIVFNTIDAVTGNKNTIYNKIKISNQGINFSKFRYIELNNIQFSDSSNHQIEGDYFIYFLFDDLQI
jgi:hypothetical protein